MITYVLMARMTTVARDRQYMLKTFHYRIRLYRGREKRRRERDREREREKEERKTESDFDREMEGKKEQGNSSFIPIIM